MDFLNIKELRRGADGNNSKVENAAAVVADTGDQAVTATRGPILMRLPPCPVRDEARWF
jgi:hypothetical protein